jgi:hypothetical protein
MDVSLPLEEVVSREIIRKLRLVSFASAVAWTQAVYLYACGDLRCVV